jgi:hypothetical protein
VQASGNVAILGKVTLPSQNPPSNALAVNVPVDFTDPADALVRGPGDLGNAVATAFAQTPGPNRVTAVRVDSANPDWRAALAIVANLDVQLVVLAGVTVSATTASTAQNAEGALISLVKHVSSVSDTGAEGRQRMGVAMLAKDSVDLAQFASGSGLIHERMVYIAHRSDQDAAAAVAGVIAGYEPHVSLLLKPVAIASPPFTQAQIETLNNSEDDTAGPAGKGVNWLTSPSIIPGGGVYLGESYTGNPGGKKYIDIVRFCDKVNFEINAKLIRSIGNVRISRSGLRALVAQIEAILQPMVRDDILNDFQIVVPLISLLDRDPATLTAAEAQQISNAEVGRFVDLGIVIHYAGAIHRLSISLKFD